MSTSDPSDMPPDGTKPVGEDRRTGEAEPVLGEEAQRAERAEYEAAEIALRAELYDDEALTAVQLLTAAGWRPPGAVAALLAAARANERERIARHLHINADVAEAVGEDARAAGLRAAENLVRRTLVTAVPAQPALGVPWIAEVRRALDSAEAHPGDDRAEHVAGYLVNFVRSRESAAEARGAAAERRRCDGVRS